MAQSINLQITPSGVTPTIYASQFDVGREITFNLYDGPTAYIPPAGSTIRFEGKKSDGNGFSYDCNYTDNVVTVVLTDQMTVFAENVTCELRIADINANDIGTLNVILSVEKSPIDGDTSISDTEIPAIVELARAEQYNAEAWAEGTRNGVPVGPTDPTYENNAKYYAEHSSASIANLSDTDIQNLTDGQILKYDANSDKWVNDDESGGSSTLGGLTDVTLTTPTNNQILKYDSVNDEWVNGDAPSGGGMVSHIIVISDAGESSVTVTLPSGTVKTCTQVSGSTTQWETTSDEYGTHIIDAYKDGDDAQTSLNIQYVGEYTIHDEHYVHTINVTVMSGAAIVVTGNGETYSGTGTGSAVAFAVHGKEATYTVTTTVDGASAPSQTVTTPATSGQSTSLTFQYGTINLTYDDDFRGQTISCVSGGITISKTAPSGANTMAFYPPGTGNWVISGTVSGDTYYASPNPVVVSSLSTSVSASLESLPNGSTVTPTDDIQTWLKCAGITDKTTYSTLADVLGDTDTFIALCADSNASDYMARSTTWASGVCADATAMQIVGKYGYCADALRDDNTWNTAINNSPYASYVPATPVVPVGTVIHSAVEDNIYYMSGGSQASFCGISSGDTGTVLSSTIESLKNQTVTLYSSVAKDPTNLSNDYSKAVRITPNVTEIYLMPDKALYWWGRNDGVEDMITANGWTWSGVPMTASVFNTNDILITNGGIGTKDKVTGTVKAIVQGVTAQASVYGATATVPSKTFSNADRQNDTEITSNSLHVISTNISDKYLTAVAVNGRSITMSALFAE